MTRTSTQSGLIWNIHRSAHSIVGSWLPVCFEIIGHTAKRDHPVLTAGDLWCGEGKCVAHGYEALVKHTCTLYCLHNDVRGLWYTRKYTTQHFSHTCLDPVVDVLEEKWVCILDITILLSLKWTLEETKQYFHGTPTLLLCLNSRDFGPLNMEDYLLTTAWETSQLSNSGWHKPDL